MFILFHIQCSIVNKYKGKDALRRIPHASDGWKLNPFPILNKQGHIIEMSMGIYQLRYGALRFSLTQVYFSSFLIQTDNQYFSILMFWQIRYVNSGQYSPSQYFSLQLSKTLRCHLCLKIFRQFSRSQHINKYSLKKRFIFHVAILLVPEIFHRPTLFSTTSTVTVSSTLSSVIFYATLPSQNIPRNRLLASCCVKISAKSSKTKLNRPFYRYGGHLEFYCFD